VPRFLQDSSRSPEPSGLASDRDHASGWARDQLDEAKTWAATAYGPKDITGAGGLGGFTAWYFPFGGPGILHLVQHVAAQFKDTLVESGGTISPHADLPATPGITALAARIQAMPEPDRTLALSNYQWTNVAERAQWLADLEALIESAWDFQRSFFLNQPYWDWIGADVNIDVRARIGAKQATDHMDIEAYELPTGESLRNHGIREPLRSDHDSARLSNAKHTGGIMSFGDEVRPQQHATFHHALETVTAKSPWALGEAACAEPDMPPCSGDTCVASTSLESESAEN